MTHQVALAAPKADLVICLDSHGNIVTNCSPSQLKESILRSPVILSRKSTLESENGDHPFGDIHLGGMKSSKSFTFLESIIAAVDAAENSPSNAPDITTQPIKQILETNGQSSFKIPVLGNSNSLKSSRKGKIIEVEGKRFGEVPLSVYWFYLKACGGKISTFLLVLASVMIIAFT